MPTNGSGVYTLPVGYVAVPGTTILDTQHNSPLEDLQQGMTDRLMRNGSNAMTGPLTLAGDASADLHAVPKQQLDAAVAAAAVAFNATPSTGTANAQVVAAMAGFALAAGARAGFVAGYTNTGAMTLNLASTGVKNVYRDSPSGPQALTGGEVIAGQLVSVVYNGTQFVLQNSSETLLGPLTALASATTTDLGTVPSHNIQITGTTTITSFGSTASTTYPIYLISFTGILTLTHNASSLILPGSANIITAVGDSALVTYLGSGNYRVTSYNRANGLNIVPSVAVPVRQTVLSGPVDADGLPNFWPATSGSLTLTMQNVTTTPLTIALANGFSSGGALDTVVRVTTNLADTFSASTTTYVYIDETNTRTLSSLAPIYQRGGTISAVNGQHTYDIAAGLMYVGNGSSATAVTRVCIGEVTTNGSTVTSAICYAYQGKYEVTDTVNLPGVSTFRSFNHNIGLNNVIVELQAVCITAEGNYVVGEVVRNLVGYNGVYAISLAVSTTSKVVRVATASSNPITVLNSAGNLNPMTAANWRLRFIVQRSWK